MQHEEKAARVSQRGKSKKSTLKIKVKVKKKSKQLKVPKVV